MYKYLIIGLFFCASLSASVNIEELETELVAMINREREKKGLQPLVIWDALTEVAREHSQNMADKSVDFGHDGFQGRIDQVIEYAPIKKIGENVAYSIHIKDPLKAATKGWMKSPGHRENILDDFEVTGIGIAFDKKGKFFVTQLFAIQS